MSTSTEICGVRRLCLGCQAGSVMHEKSGCCPIPSVWRQSTTPGALSGWHVHVAHGQSLRKCPCLLCSREARQGDADQLPVHKAAMLSLGPGFQQKGTCFEVSKVCKSVKPNHSVHVKARQPEFHYPCSSKKLRVIVPTHGRLFLELSEQVEGFMLANVSGF